MQRVLFSRVGLEDERVGLQGRQTYGKAASLSFDRGDGELSLVHLDDLFGQVEADSRAVFVDLLVRRGAVVLVEDEGQLLLADAAPGILDTDIGIEHLGGLLADADRHQHAPAPGREFQCIGEQILKDRLHADTVEHEDVADFKIKVKDLALKFYTLEATVGTANVGQSKSFDKLLAQILSLSKAEQSVILRKVVNG